MKKIIRQILDDLSARSKTSNPDDSVKNDAPTIYEPAVSEFLSEPQHNQGEIKVHEGQPGGPNLGNLDQNPKYQAPLPQDPHNQILSKHPLEHQRQLDYQAQESEVRQTS